MKVTSKQSRIRSSLIGSVLCALLIVIAAGAAWAVFRNQAPERGTIYGMPQEFAVGRTLQGIGVNADLTRFWDRYPAGSSEKVPADSAYTIDNALLDMKRAGIGWVRQPFPWAVIEPQQGRFNWEPWDAVVAACSRQGIDVVAVLHTFPPWAKKPSGGGDPFSPADALVDFGRFAEELAFRYRESLEYYEIWDAPNIQSNWGDALVNPVQYMRLLREASIQIREVDSDAVIVLAGLAPTTEVGPLNLSEPLYLQDLYAAGAAPFFDVVAAKPYGFWSGPDDRRVDGAALNFSRVILLREVMEANGDAAKPIWAVEMGWNALPPDWSGDVSVWGTDEEGLQTERTLGAIQRARKEWPWLTAIGLAAFHTSEETDDARTGFAMLDESYRPRRLYQAIAGMAGEDNVAYPGHHRSDDPAVRYDGGNWRVRSSAADVGEEGDRAALSFYGTRLDLKVRRGQFWGLFYVSVDGQPVNGLPRDDQGRSYLVLHDPLEREAAVTVASGLMEGFHRVEIEAHGGWEQWPLLGFTVMRERSSPMGNLLLAVCLILGIVGIAGAIYNGVSLPWGDWWPAVLAFFDALDKKWRLAILAFAAVLFYFSPNLWLSLLCLVFLIVWVCLTPVLGLVLVTFCIPFFLQTKDLPGRSFGVTELALIVVLLGAAMHYGLWGLAAWPARQEKFRFYELGLRIYKSTTRNPQSVILSLDVAMVLLVVASAVSVLAAENFGVANRELRVVILEPAIFYFLLRVLPLKRGDVWLLGDALIVAAVVLALIGLYQYGFTADIISAEGVRRIKGVYASPNNLSLFLGRIVSLLLAFTLTLPMSRRRILYGLAAVPVLLCLYLTYSRGAWLIGLPAALVFIVLVRGRRALGWGLAALAALVLSLVPLVGTDRISRLASMQTETAFLRVKLWQATLNMIRDHPLFGVGLDNFLYQYRTRYILPEAWREPNLSHPHNVLLDYWTRLGIPGIVVLVVQQWSFFRTGFGLYRNVPNEFARTFVLALMTSMVYSLAHGFIDNSFFLVDLSFVLALSFGLMAKLVELNNRTIT